jgi:GNAT superfamily N-acetyltransferase
MTNLPPRPGLQKPDAMTIHVRPATSADAAAMADLINVIIAIGGTTAYEDPFDAGSIDAAYISLPELVSCFVAEVDGALAGFQGLMRSFDPDDPLPDGWATIGTFARVGLTQRGVGSALFARTLAAARMARISVIDATIRADNAGGLAFYGRQGFIDYDCLIGVPLKNGARVDRVRKRFDIR